MCLCVCVFTLFPPFFHPKKFHFHRGARSGNLCFSSIHRIKPKPLSNKYLTMVPSKRRSCDVMMIGIGVERVGFLGGLEMAVKQPHGSDWHSRVTTIGPQHPLNVCVYCIVTWYKLVQVQYKTLGAFLGGVLPACLCLSTLLFDRFGKNYFYPCPIKAWIDSSKSCPIFSLSKFHRGKLQALNLSEPTAHP